MTSVTLALLLALAAQPSPPPVILAPAPPPPPPPIFQTMPPDAFPRPPIQRAGTITNDDYPAAAIRAEEEGTVSVRLTVGVSGRAEGCTVIRSSGSSVLDSTTCSLLVRRVRFDPARDESGRAVTGTITRTVRWELPDDVTLPGFVSGRVVAAEWPSPTQPCATVSSVPALAPISQDLCAGVFGSSAPETAGAVAARRPTVAILSISASTAEPARPRAPGRLVYREDASFEVAPTGEVIACNPNVRLNATPQSAFDLCRYLATEDDPFFEAFPGVTARRKGRMTLEMYETAAPVDPASLVRP